MEYYYAPPRPWYRPRVRTLLVWILAAFVASTLYSYWTESRDEAARRQRELLAPPAGATCNVVFRSDALGTEPTALTSAIVNGVKNYVTGRFVMLNDDWIVLEPLTENESQRWIPIDAVLLIEVAR